MIAHLMWIWLVSSLVMVVTWAWCWRINNAGYVDVVWAMLMAIAALYIGLVGDGAPLSRGLVAMFGSVWGARLCLHLLLRVLHEPEDGRYRNLRAHWQGDQFKFFLFFQSQSLFVVLFSVPLLAAASNPFHGFNQWTIAAIAVWFSSLLGESIADRQLARFRENPENRGTTCRTGLWAWSRHPNYFFEWLHWFAYVLLAIGSPWQGIAWLGPVMMLLFLYRVTGIPYSEAQALRSRGEDYARYQRQVSAFFPWPPTAQRNTP